MTPPADPYDDEEPLPPYVPLSEEPMGPVADTPMMLSHHFPEDYDRCAVVAGFHVCRRCLVLYPVALVTGVVISLGSWWPDSLRICLHRSGTPAR